MNKNKMGSLNDWNGFFDELQNESPRAAVIIAGAFLDAQLRTLLSNAFVDKPKIVDDLLERSLHSFDSRIKMTYCMGLISESMYHDLDVIRQIRNKFAHKMHGYSFDDPEIVKWCKSLKLAKMISDVSQMPKSHGNLFLLGVSQLAMWLGMKIVETEKSHNTVPKDPELAQFVSVDASTKAA